MSDSELLGAGLERIIAEIFDSLLVIDENHYILQIRQKSRKFFQCADGSVGRLIYDCLAPELKQKFRAAIKKCLQTEQISEISFDHFTDKRRKFYRVKFISSSGGRVIILLNDETAWHSTEEQVVENQKMESIGSLAAGLAHEINTPMQYIASNISFLDESLKQLLGYVQELELVSGRSSARGTFFKEEIPKAIDDTLSGIKHVTKIIESLREYAHPSSVYQEVNLPHLLETVFTISRGEWKNIAEVKSYIPEDVHTVRLLSGTLDQCLLNLVVNAAHAIESKKLNEPGLIEISIKDKSHWLEVRVKDNGIGIPEANLERIFDPFFTTKEVGKGTGQGLAIVYKSVTDKLKGTIEVQSEEGVGTEFILNLPKVEQKALFSGSLQWFD